MNTAAFAGAGITAVLGNDLALELTSAFSDACRMRPSQKKVFKS